MGSFFLSMTPATEHIGKLVTDFPATPSTSHFLNPSLIGTMKYDEKKISGRQMIDVRNTMNFDLAAFGNHEFDLSKATTKKVTTILINLQIV